MNISLKYNTRTFRIFMAMGASLYILFHGRTIDLVGALKSPAFFVAFPVSTIVAILLIKVVHYTTIWLDRYCQWDKEPIKRMFLQSFICVLGPILIDFVLLSVYFYMTGANIFENGFIRFDFPIIILFIILLNSYYVIRYLFASSKVEPKPLINQPDCLVVYDEPFPEHPELVKLLKSQCEACDFSNITLELDILYFYSFNKQIYLVLKTGAEYKIDLSLNVLNDLFSEINFARINRSVILNLETIAQDYEQGEKRNTLILDFYPEYRSLLKDKSPEFFVVTKQYIRNTKSLFDRF